MTMAIIRCQQASRVEDRTLFSSHSGDIYIEQIESADGLFEHKRIYCASPTTSNFNTGTSIGDEIIDTANGVKYRKTAAAVWATITQA